jgi:hypothetical protein
MRLAILILIACIVPAQDFQRITGRVLDDASRTPVIAATVTLSSSAASQQIVTDSQGSFTFLDTPPGEYTLTARRLPSSQSGSNAVNVKVESGHAPEAVELAVPSTALVTGVVTGENAQPLSANVELIRRTIQNGEATMEPSGAVTNDLGEYRLADMRPGRYLVCATAHTSLYKQRHHLVYPLNCYPGVPNRESAQWIDLQPGSELRLDLHFALVHSVRVTGSLRGAGEQVSISIAPLNQSSSMLGGAIAEWDAKTRTFVVAALPAGDYVVRASEYRDGMEHSASRLLHAGTEDIDGIELDLSAATQLTGSVTFEGEPPPAANPTSFSASGNRLQLYAWSNGNFSFPIPPPGTYYLSAHGGGYCPRSATLGGRDVLDSRFTIAPESLPGPLDIVFSKDCGHLFVSFQSNQTALKPILLRHAAEGDGYLRFESTMFLTPGDYLVFLVPNDPNLEYMDPAWLRDHESSAIPVTIQANQPTMLKLP